MAEHWSEDGVVDLVPLGIMRGRDEIRGLLRASCSPPCPTSRPRSRSVVAGEREVGRRVADERHLHAARRSRASSRPGARSSCAASTCSRSRTARSSRTPPTTTAWSSPAAVGLLPAQDSGRRAGDEERLQRRHQSAAGGHRGTRRARAAEGAGVTEPPRPGGGLIVFVALTIGLVFWIAAWAFGVKSFDAFMVTMALVVGAAAYVIVKPFVNQLLGRDAARGRGRRSPLLAEERLGDGVVLGRHGAQLRDRVAERHQLDPASRAAPASCPSAARARRRSRPRRTASPARGRTRSGVPPRWMWPSTVARVSKPVRSLDLALEPLADAAEALVAELVLGAVDHLERALLGRRALGDDDDREVAPARVAAPDQPADLVDVERAARGSGSRRRRRRARSAARSSRRGGPSPRRPSRGCGSRRWCAGGRSPRWRPAPRCRSRRSCRCRRGRCRSSSARRAPAGRARRAGARPRRACPRRRSRSAPSRCSVRRFSRDPLGRRRRA